MTSRILSFRILSIKQNRLLCLSLIANCFWNVDANAVEKHVDSVITLLQNEANGEAIDRAALLKSSNSSIEERAVKWHRGEVFIEGDWIAIEDLSEQHLSKNIKEYLRQRSETTLDMDGHRKLAKWCETHSLEQQARAHWFGILEINPIDEMARAKLGFQLIEGEWFTGDEIATAMKAADERLKNLQKSMPKMQQLHGAIRGQDTKKKSKAIDELNAIKDPASVYALQVTVLQCQEDVALPFVRAIGNFHSLDSCNAFTNIAVANPTSEAGQAAIVLLKEYPLECYVPNLINSLGSTIDLNSRVFVRPNGEQVLRRVATRDLRYAKQFAVYDRIIALDVQSDQNLNQRNFGRNRTSVSPRTRSSELNRSFGGQNVDVRAKNTVADSVLLNDAKEDNDKFRNQVAVQNNEIQMRQAKVLAVLRECTSAECGDVPSEWWNWWDQQNERVRSKTKGYQYSYNQDSRKPSSTDYRVRATIPTYSAPRPSVTQPQPTDRPTRQPTVRRGPVRFSYECLVAGTAIQSQSGLRPIETIREGDLVLSQNIESGELEFKPVLRTTLRPPTKTFRFTTASGESTEATLGHFWWIAGKGWVRTKELEVGMPMHHAKGTSKIVSIEETPKEVETYNLVVADSHTYFVGTERLLSWDATEVQPTLQLVPGLPAPVLAKK